MVLNNFLHYSKSLTWLETIFNIYLGFNMALKTSSMNYKVNTIVNVPKFQTLVDCQGLDKQCIL